MSEVGRGEALCADGERRLQKVNDIARLTNLIPGSDQIEAAVCFYKALKVYPAPSESFRPPFPPSCLPRGPDDAMKSIEETACTDFYVFTGDLISIYDKTVPKPVLDILAEMIASDPTIPMGPPGSRGPSSESGIDG